MEWTIYFKYTLNFLMHVQYGRRMKYLGRSEFTAVFVFSFFIENDTVFSGFSTPWTTDMTMIFCCNNRSQVVLESISVVIDDVFKMPLSVPTSGYKTLGDVLIDMHFQVTILSSVKYFVDMHLSVAKDFGPFHRCILSMQMDNAIFLSIYVVLCNRF